MRGGTKSQLEKHLSSLTDTNLSVLTEAHLDSSGDPQRAALSAEDGPRGALRKTDARSTSLPATCYCLSQDPRITLGEVNVSPTELLLSH